MQTITRKPDAPSGKERLVDVPSHAIADVIGAVIGSAAVGAAVGTVAGPAGTAIGAVAGAIAGSLGADAVVNSVDQAREDAHWHENYRGRPYVATNASYDDYSPAYRFGVMSFSRNPDRSFDELAPELSLKWPAEQAQSTLAWGDASLAARDAWDRLALQRRAGAANR